MTAGADLALLVEQFYGVLWYRLSITRDVLDDRLAERLAAAAVAQVGGARPVG